MTKSRNISHLQSVLSSFTLLKDGRNLSYFLAAARWTLPNSTVSEYPIKKTDDTALIEGCSQLYQLKNPEPKKPQIHSTPDGTHVLRLRARIGAFTENLHKAQISVSNEDTAAARSELTAKCATKAVVVIGSRLTPDRVTLVYENGSFHSGQIKINHPKVGILHQAEVETLKDDSLNIRPGVNSYFTPSKAPSTQIPWSMVNRRKPQPPRDYMVLIGCQSLGVKVHRNYGPLGWLTAIKCQKNKYSSYHWESLNGHFSYRGPSKNSSMKNQFLPVKNGEIIFNSSPKRLVLTIAEVHEDRLSFKVQPDIFYNFV